MKGFFAGDFELHLTHDRSHTNKYYLENLTKYEFVSLQAVRAISSDPEIQILRLGMEI